MSDQGDKVVPIGSKRGGDSVRKMNRHELEAENERLRALLEHRPIDVTSDGPIFVDVDDGFRDRMAARAYIAAQGNALAALRAMGVATDTDSETKLTSQGLTIQKLQALAKQIFESPAVREMVREHRYRAEEQKDAIVSRLVETALNGSPADHVRAATVLAKMFGWMAPTKMQVQSQTLSFTAALSDPSKMQQLVGMLGHEPGEAVRIESEVTKRAALPVSSEPTDE